MSTPGSGSAPHSAVAGLFVGFDVPQWVRFDTSGGDAAGI